MTVHFGIDTKREVVISTYDIEENCAWNTQTTEEAFQGIDLAPHEIIIGMWRKKEDRE